ncbi:MAG: tyrosine-type recombinase/integrase [Planctomycetaceae bacterium]|nr:tyrosine-type recombinase/integrase [Planctomycetaceae bacterium]
MPRRKGRAWIKQLSQQVAKHGKRAASWYCVWNEPTGRRRMRSCGPGPAGRKLAAKLAEQLNAAMTLGTYQAEQTPPSPSWDSFAGQFVHQMHGCRLSSITEAEASLNTFARVLKLGAVPVSSITPQHVADFIAQRSKERGRKPGSVVSPATVAKDLRVIKSALRAAVRAKLLAEIPVVKMPRLDSKLHRAVSDQHFAAMYAAADTMTLPALPHCTAAEFWRGLLVFVYMSGFRIGATLAIEWRDVDLEAATVLCRAEVSKGRRDNVVALHDVVIEHLRPLELSSNLDASSVFAWPFDRTKLTDTLHALQAAAGIDLPCIIPRPHGCTVACHRYGWHDFRRAFACNNATRLPATVLQHLMQHRSFQTTKLYVQLAEQLRPTLQNLHVPAALQLAGRDADRVGTERG